MQRTNAHPACFLRAPVGTSLSSPNRMLWQMSASMRRAARRARDLREGDEMKQEVFGEESSRFPERGK